MTNRSRVFLRADNTFKCVPISSTDKPDITKEIVDKWKRIINLACEILSVPSALVMKITKDSMQVYLKSNNIKNPYIEQSKEHLGAGLYCETVIGNDNDLLVENSLQDSIWKDNPDVELNMISYYGLPIKWPDSEFFGTICVLDDKSNKFSTKYKKLMYEFKCIIETDLKMLLYQHKLEYYSNIDALTGVYNRRKLESLLKYEFNRSKRHDTLLSVAIMDINKFKNINDTLGHDIGDEVLKKFANSVNSRIRETDFFGRWGGDEFLLICPNTDLYGIEKLITDIKSSVYIKLDSIVKGTTFSHGRSIYKQDDTNYQQIVKRADVELYKAKSKIALK